MPERPVVMPSPQQHNQQHQEIDQLAESFSEMTLDGHDEEAPVGRHGAEGGNIYDERLLPTFNRRLSSARAHAKHGREREMNDDLAAALVLAEMPGASVNHQIKMSHYDAHARLTRRSLQAFQQG